MAIENPLNAPAIMPTVGRVVWYYPNGNAENNKPLAAIICHVHGPNIVNLMIISSLGNPAGFTSIILLNPGEVSSQRCAAWMPHQIGQVGKVDEAQKKLDQVAKEAAIAKAAHDKKRDEEGSMPITQFQPIGEVVRALKLGRRARRSGWNGKGVFIYLVPGSLYPEGTEINYRDHVYMRTADGSCVPWLCSQTDLLAEDWEIL